jgi:hypothetical protein
MKKYTQKIMILMLAVAPLMADAFCPIPSLTQNTYVNQQLQQQYQQCLNNEQYQQQQIQIQQEQLNIQRQQLQIQQQQQQQNNRVPNQYIGGSNGGLNFDLLRK